MTIHPLQPIALKSQTVNFQVAPPLSLYIHIPWCVRKCPYCDFNSYTLSGELPQGAYLDALLHDLRAQAGATQLVGRRLTSVFMGGGTPSLFSPAAIGRVLENAPLRIHHATLARQRAEQLFDAERNGLRLASVLRGRHSAIASPAPDLRSMHPVPSNT